jgi:GT2 family glycosyltransferase
MRHEESPTLQTLLNAVEETSLAELEIGIFIQDNTPGGQDPSALPCGIRYEAAQGNPGLAKAYNRALDIAQAEGYDWLLTLDQDTVLPIHFFTRITKLARTLESSPKIGAIVPQVVDGDRNLSPFRFELGAVPRWFRYGHVGISHRPTYALNSAATLRVTALRQIGGYDPMFPLDVSDINVFHRLYRHGYEVFLAGDLCISHNFSLLNKHQRMSLERYRAMLWDECAFWDINMGRMARLERLIRLAGRVCKDLLIPQEAAFRKIAIAELRRRLMTSRANRIVEWTNWAMARSGLSDMTSDFRNIP